MYVFIFISVTGLKFSFTFSFCCNVTRLQNQTETKKINFRYLCKNDGKVKEFIASVFILNCSDLGLSDIIFDDNA